MAILEHVSILYQWAECGILSAVHPPRSSVCPSVCSAGHLITNLMNGLSNLDQTYGEYSLGPTDNLIRYRRSKVKVTTGHQGRKVIHVFTGTSKSI